VAIVRILRIKLDVREERLAYWGGRHDNNGTAITIPRKSGCNEHIHALPAARTWLLQQLQTDADAPCVSSESMACLLNMAVYDGLIQIIRTQILVFVIAGPQIL